MTYLDYSATTPVDDEVLDTFVKASKYIGNPNSLHKLGTKAKHLIDASTNQIASILNIKPSEIIYTSGASESNNTIIKAMEKFQNRGKHIITTALEHSSIYAPLKQLEEKGFIIDYVPLENGLVKLDTLEKLLTNDTVLVTIAMVSSETGIRQPIEEIGKLLKKYPDQKKISILDLINDQDKEIQKLGRFIYKNVFENYTAKQWNMPISQIDTSVINRVPVILDYDDRYFQDKIQYMPKDGYTEIFNNMLNHPNITVELSTNALDKLTVKGNKIYYLQQEFTNPVIYSGAIDELFSYQYGALPYRSLKLDFETKNMNYYQPVSVVNYPNEEKFTRITEFKYFSNCLLSSSTTILKEYPQNYDHKNEKTIPYYTIQNEENLKLYHQYLNQANKIPNLYLCGRLAEYKYYNMDAVIERALDLYETIFEKTHK